MEPVGETPRAMHEVVADRIRRAILDGHLEPGQRLVEDRLAQEYDVSRHPVREALRTLQLEGLVDTSPRRGARVSSVSPEEVVELLEVLAALDGLSARLACDADDDAKKADIGTVLDNASAILRATTDSLAPSDLELLARLNRELHTLVAQVGGNKQLIDTTTPLRDRIQWNLAAVARRRPELSWAEHEEIFNAISTGDADRAETLARAHIDAAKASYVSRTRDGTKPSAPTS